MKQEAPRFIDYLDRVAPAGKDTRQLKKVYQELRRVATESGVVILTLKERKRVRQ